MPADRFLHAVLGHSEKVNMLTDLEFRVWAQYLLSADDFGVMRFSAVTVQSANDALHARSGRIVQRCLERLVDVGLLVDFEHQKRKYLCQLDWGKRQPMKYPSGTMNPAPPKAILDRCDEATVGRFFEHHAGMVDAGGDAHQVVVDDAGAGAPQVIANSLRLTANGLRERFSEFWKMYPRRVGKDKAWKAWQKVKPSQELLGQMLATLAWQVKQEDWTKDRGQFIPHPATWLNNGRWDDEPTDTLPAPLPANKRIAGAFTGGQAFLNRGHS